MALAHIRHELRTPLNAIIGYSEMLIEDAETKHLDAFIPDLRNILALGNTILGIVNDTLTTPPNGTEPIDVDLERIEEALESALQTPLAGVRDRSRKLLKLAGEADKPAVISDLEKIRSACERFQSQIHNIEAGALCDPPGKAAAYAFDAAADTRGSSFEKEEPSRPVARSTVLVVDDDEMNRDLLCSYLQRQGHDVTVAEDGRQALDRVGKSRFDLILLDVLMPEMNGDEVLTELKCTDGLRDIPVLMISSLEEVDIVARCIETGADDYLPKPFNSVLLGARIRSCLEKKRLQDLERGYRRALSEAFGKYVAHEVRDEVMSGRIPLDGELKEVTALFADLRDFTPLTESTPPKEVVHILNVYFSEMAPAISRHHGSVLRYVGDEIFAVFGAPLPLEDHPSHALEAALDMRRLLVVVNERLKKTNQVQLEQGIGIHTGQVVAAIIGSPDRQSYDIVGDTANLGSRIQELTKKYDTDILISGETRRLLPEDVPVVKLAETAVKGRKGTVEIYGVP
jgi:adenylate cyclase